MKLSKKQKEVLKWAKENLKGKSIYCPILETEVYFSMEGGIIKKSLKERKAVLNCLLVLASAAAKFF